MSSEESSVLRSIAITIWHCRSLEAEAAKEATEADLKRRVDRFHAELQRVIGTDFELQITVNGGCLEAKIGDLRFVACDINPSRSHDQMTLVTLLGRCHACGIETMSEPFYNLAGLGKVLEKFKPIQWHYCPAQLSSSK